MEAMGLMPFRLRVKRIIQTFPHAVVLSIILSVVLYVFTDGYWMLVVWSVGFVVQLLVLALFIGRWKRFKIRRAIKREHNPALTALLRIPFLKISETSYESRIACIRDIRSASPVPVVSIVDTTCQESIQEIEITNELLEPDSLGTGGLTRWGCSSVFGIVATLFLVWVLFTSGTQLGMDPAFVWLVSIGALMLGAWHTPIRGKIHRFLNKTAAQNIVGPGFFVHSKTVQWTVNNSIMVVGVKGVEVHTEVIAVLIGPAGAKHLRFNSTKDQEFIRLWRYWNHPVPRTELLDSLF